MDSNKEISCPTTPGLSQDGGFRPGFSWSDLLHDPSANWHIWGWLLCLLCLLITWIISITVIIKHLRNYYEPEIQRHKLRVLLFPPFYSTLAWISYLRYDYATTIIFFATLFEAFAVYNLYTGLQAYLRPYRDENEGVKEEAHPTVMPLIKIHVKSRWGMHYRIITDILVYQFPLWSVFDAFISIFAELKGRYCADSYSFKGAHVYLTIINFIALSLIISALFTYLAVYKDEWKRARISAHGFFWCVKGPIMINFYIGTLLLSGLAYAGVIHGTDGSHSSDGLAWSTEAVKNGLEVIIECVVMTVFMGLMTKYFGPQDSIRRGLSTQGALESDDQFYYNSNVNGDNHGKLSFGAAFYDAYINYIPEFFRNVVYCGKDSRELAKKRARMREQKKMEAINT
ncbi:organic solute transporter Ostalpha-domain-containing protein [Halteromyces radiatus]|uniref:organic solute transporter Ostalpha-domain-containing protein n=1 Tax=Halteromyces radiatus TaxID=101107 RepID=UPI002220EFA8|nr:organic solute transporter Ostalpha-domain-containing protein [Halteromyces radiatus]KAI8086528.1 organic solute transporter Ostalpha-domain-containing protein [Halteromyces radiatus]